MTVLAHDIILNLHGAAIAAGLADTRGALLSGIDPQIAASLPVATNPSAQVLSDLELLNRRGGEPLLRPWLANAARLSSPRVESEVFLEALSTLEAMESSSGRAPSMHSAAGFVGRDYLFATVESFMESERSGYVSIQGESGAGKSAFVVEYARRSGCVAHFNDLSTGTTRVSQFIEGVGAQLRARFGLSGYSAPGWSRRADALPELLKRCTRQLSDREPLVIAVDAIDEAEPAAGVNALHLPAALPEHVFFLLTHRRFLPPLTVTAPWKLVDMGEHPEENDADVRAFLGAAARRPEARTWIEAQSLHVDDLVSELALRSGGNFMYLRRVLGAIDDGRYADRALADLPRDLWGYHEERWIDLSRRTSLPGSARNAIAYVLAEAKRPVSAHDIGRLTGVAEEVVRATIADLVDLLRVDRAGSHETYSVAHSSFREFLYWQDSVQAAGVTLAGAHRTMDDALSTLLGDWREAP